MKINVSIHESKIITWRCHARKFHFRTDASRDTLCTRELNTQLPRISAARAFHLLPSNRWVELWPEPKKCRLNDAH